MASKQHPASGAADHGPRSMRAVWLFGGLALALLVGLGVYLAPLQPNILALQFAFSRSAFEAVLQAWQPSGVLRFRAHLPVDGLLLLSYGLFGYLAVTRAACFGVYAAMARARMALLMPLAASCDSLENLLHAYLTGATDAAPSYVYVLAATAATLKWLGIALFLVCGLMAVLTNKSK